MNKNKHLKALPELIVSIVQSLNYTYDILQQKHYILSHSVSMCFVRLSKQAPIISLNTTEWLVVTVDTASTICEAETGFYT